MIHPLTLPTRATRGGVDIRTEPPLADYDFGAEVLRSYVPPRLGPDAPTVEPDTKPETQPDTNPAPPVPRPDPAPEHVPGTSPRPDSEPVPSQCPIRR